MKRLDPFLPIFGVVGLIALWYFAVWNKVVDPVLLPSPTDAAIALWKGMNGGKLGIDFIQTMQRTVVSIAIAAVIAIPLGILIGLFIAWKFGAFRAGYDKGKEQREKWRRKP